MFMSTGLNPSSSFQLKAWKSEPNIKCNIRIASSKPGHVLLPPPNGNSSKFSPITSISDPKNLSGMNDFALFHDLGPRPIAHAFTSTCAPFGIM
uniref:Uncharacterized protein n=1 Tax=Quercus lobata TaxID=97700 RepID=A0A7N2N1H3_QUELO